MFLAYQAPRGHTLLDRALYLPKSWTEDRARCQAAGVPDTVRFATKPRLAEQMLTRAFAAGIPARWVTGDSVYGSDRPLPRFLEAHPVGYVLGVSSGYTVRPYTAGGLAQALPKKVWKRLSAGPGSKGPRGYEWARSPLGPNQSAWDRWLLLRRSVDEPHEYAYYCVRAPHDTTLKQMVAVAGPRWAVEECFEIAKGDCGLDEYEVRRWTGWHRQVTLSMLALAYLTVVRTRATATPAPKKKSTAAQREELIPLTVPEVQGLLWHLVWREAPFEQSVLDWSHWRRKHQAMARRGHYRKRSNAP